MLILSRQRSEEVVIFDPDGNELGRVMLVRIIGDRVRLGFKFPSEYAIHRSAMIVPDPPTADAAGLE